MTFTEQMKQAMDELKESGINGCFAGSSMTGADFDLWESKPDIDIFVYEEPELLHACDYLRWQLGYEPLNPGEEWKLNRQRKKASGYKNNLATLKLKRGEIIVNVTYKRWKNNIFSVLSSFDMSIIMVGYDIPKHVMLDLRCGWDGMVPEDPDNRWSHDINVAVPNPLRNQDCDLYEVEMWVRQFNRCIKYWDRGYDTRPMARFYIDAITKVIETGSLFSTDKSQAVYDEFVEVYTPVKEKMQAWLADKED